MEVQAKINEALELALEAIDKETKPQQQQQPLQPQPQQQQLPQQQPETLYPITVPSSNTTTNNLIFTEQQQDAGEDQPHVVEILLNKTDEEKCEKLKLDETFTVAAITEKSEEEISKEPIYENIISTTSMQEVDVALNAGKTSAITSSIMIEREAQLIPSMISNQIDNNQQQKQQKLVNESNQNQIKSQFNSNNNNNSNQNQNPNHNQIQKSIQNLSNQLKISQINRNNNCSINNNNNVVELTNAFANTTITTTATTPTNNLLSNNNKNNNISCDLSSLPKTTLFKETLTINNDQKQPIKHKSTESQDVGEHEVERRIEEEEEDNNLPPHSKEIMTDLMPEPYYQVPKSNEPYYDAPKHLRPVPVYENIEIFFNGSLNGDLSTGGSMPTLQPPKEKPPPPPVESPPLFDDVDSSCHTDTWSSDNTYETLSRHQIQHHKNINNNNNNANNHSQHHLSQDQLSPPIKRMNSTRRIKKELRNKRSSFLGIEGSSLDDDESYLELTVAPPPDMAQLLQEERRLEKQLYLKAGLCDSSDTGESRDSGVSENHSRQSSEHYTNSSEENETHDDSTSPLTLQTQGALSTQTPDLLYQNDGLLAVAPTPLLQTVKGNSAESWTESATVAAAATQSLSEATATANAKMMSIEEKIREQEEVLRVERELLQFEQEELKRQRENLLLRETMARRELQHGAKMLMSANRRSLQNLNGLGSMTVHNGIMGDEALITPNNMDMYHQKMTHAMQQQQQQQQQLHNTKQYQHQQTQQIYANIPNLQQQYYHMETDYRKSMSDINEFSKRMMSQALPPAPPSKPMRAMHVNTAVNNAPNGLTATRDQLEQNDFVSRQRHSLNSQNFGGSLVKIASPPPPPNAAPRGSAHIYTNYHHQSVQNLSTSPNNPATNNSNLSATQQSLYPGNMSRNTLHALSATPKPKYTDGWVQVQQRKSFDSNLANDPAWMSAHQQKRKSMPDTYYNQHNNHWLIQEAEQRRLVEQQHQQQRRVVSSNATPLHPANNLTNGSALHSSANGKPLPDSIIQTLTERVQSKGIGDRKRNNLDKSPLHAASSYQQLQYNKINQQQQQQQQSSSVNSVIQRHNNIISATAYTSSSISSSNGQSNTTTTLSQQQQHQQEKVLSVSGKKKCSHCGDELGRGAAMIIESLLLFYHINCFKCCVCHVQLGDGLNGTDVRVRNHKLHCQNCYSSDDGIKFSCV